MLTTYNNNCCDAPYGHRSYDWQAYRAIEERDATLVFGWAFYRTANPPQFHACQESRCETTKLYNLYSEASFYAVKKLYIGNGIQVVPMMNYEIDTVLLFPRHP